MSTIKALLLDETGQQIVNELNNISSKIGGATMMPITYSDLKALRDEGKLVPGQQYRITDYHCTTAQENTHSADHQFDIIVTADSESVLNENARACLHEGDTYFVNSNLAAWKLKYCLDNDTDRFVWAVYFSLSLGSEGYDYVNYVGDTAVGAAHYKWRTSDDTYYYSDLSPEELFLLAWEEQGEHIFYTSEGNYADSLSVNDSWLTEDADFVRSSGSGVIYHMKDEWNNECPYDFKNILFKRKLTAGVYDPEDGEDTWVYTFTWVNESNNIDDLSIVGQKLPNDEGQYCGVYNNCIKPINAYNNIYPESPSKFGTALNDIAFICSYTYDDGLFSGCYSNTFGNDCYSNTFGHNCHTNIFGNGCHTNIFGDLFVSNTFGNGCQSNTFGNGCYSNTFGNDCNSNTFGNDCNSNTFGNGCYSNIFGYGCQYKHLESTSNKTSGISGNTPEYWFNGAKKW